jgi:hypothetical protein
MLGNFEAIDADIVPNGISVQCVTAVDGITRIRGDGGRRAQKRNCCTCHRNQPFHDHFLSPGRLKGEVESRTYLEIPLVAQRNVRRSGFNNASRRKPWSFSYGPE